MSFIKKYWWAILLVGGLVYFFAFHEKGKGLFGENTPTPDDGSGAGPGIMDLPEDILLPDDQVMATNK